MTEPGDVTLHTSVAVICTERKRVTLNFKPTLLKSRYALAAQIDCTFTYGSLVILRSWCFFTLSVAFCSLLTLINGVTLQTALRLFRVLLSSA
jgi:hypothetical protein